MSRRKISLWEKCVLGFSTILIVSSCTSFPVPQSDKDTMLIIPLQQIIGPGAGTEIVKQYEIIVERDGGLRKVLTVNPHSSRIIYTGLIPGEYRISELIYRFIESKELLETESVDIKFMLKAGEITVLDQQFSCRYVKEAGRGVSVEDVGWKPASLSERRSILRELESNEGFTAWTAPDWYNSRTQQSELASDSANEKLPLPVSKRHGAIIGMCEIDMVDAFGGITSGVHRNRISLSLANDDTNKSYTANVTDGLYYFLNLQPGHYTIIEWRLDENNEGSGSAVGRRITYPLIVNSGEITNGGYYRPRFTVEDGSSNVQHILDEVDQIELRNRFSRVDREKAWEAFEWGYGQVTPRSFLGVGLASYNLDGSRVSGRKDGDRFLGSVLVSGVVPNHPAAMSGIQPGDSITKINNFGFRNFSHALYRLKTLEPNVNTTIEIMRLGVPIQAEVRTGPPLSEAESRNLAALSWPGVSIRLIQDNELIEVWQISPNSIADRIGIKSGDIITRVDDKIVSNVSDFYFNISSNTTDSVKLEIQRENENLTFQLPSITALTEQLKLAAAEEQNTGDNVQIDSSNQDASEIASRPYITVLDLQLNEVSDNDGKVISDLISSVLISTNKYRVIDRMQREAILDELKFSLSGCVDESCQLEMGKMLAADQIVTGNLGKVGNKFVLTIKMLYVETGEAKSTSYDIFDTLDDLVEGCEEIALQL